MRLNNLYKQNQQSKNQFTFANDLARRQERISSGIVTKPQNQNQTKNEFQQKMKLKVYLTDDARIFIDRTAAYNFGYINTRTVMSENDQKIEITDRQLATLKARENIEIEYEKLMSNKEIPTKPKIEVFVDNIDHYINMSAAYSLGIISVETFNNMSNELYKISDNLLVFLKNKYEVVYQEIDNQNKKLR